MHNIAAKTNLFYLSGIIRLLSGSWNLRQIGGLYATYPLLGLLFLVPALALAGIPPLSGFWAKLTVIQAGLEAQQWLAVSVALMVSILTLYSMIKIWNEAFLKDNPLSGDEGQRGREYHELSAGKKIALIGPAIILAMFTIVSGLWFEPFFILAEGASLELLDAGIYSKAVTGGIP
nr:proton-conducting transporter membrane subunit [Chlorobium phaeovibrioides]